MPTRDFFKVDGGSLGQSLTSRILENDKPVNFSKAEYAKWLKLFAELEGAADFYTNFWSTKERFKEYFHICYLMEIDVTDGLNLKDVSRFLKAYTAHGQFAMPDGVMVKYLSKEEEKQGKFQVYFQRDQERLAIEARREMQKLARLKSVCSKLELELSYKELVQLDRDWNEHLVFDLGYDDHKSHSDDALLVWVGDHLAK